MEPQHLQAINLFRSQKILVLGDSMLDVYLQGRSTRLSPEAPVPVVNIERAKKIPGGAANTALNVRSLGAEVCYCSVLGKDAAGDKLIELLKCAGVDTQFVLQVENRHTVVKSRVVAGTQILLRYDEGDEHPIDDETAQKLRQKLAAAYQVSDGIIVSDYDKGVVTKTIIDCLSHLADDARKFIAVDSKRLKAFKCVNPSLVKPNFEEACGLMGIMLTEEERIEYLRTAGDQLYAMTGAEHIALTLDADGAIIFKQQNFAHYLPAPKQSNAHVSGAGDTFISTFALFAMTGATPEMAARMATAAAAIAIRKEGTGHCRWEELLASFNAREKFIATHENIAILVDVYRTLGKKIVFTNGCFDILHSGHVDYLNRARELGDILIVGVNTDDSIRRIKGEQRPINPLEDRIQVLSGLSSVDHVVPFGDVSDDTPIALVRAVRPDIFVKGGDYTKDRLPEADTVELLGGRIMLLPLTPDHSTTRIIQRISQTQMA